MRAARRDRRVMCTTLRNSTAARTDPIHNCGSNFFCTHLSIWMPLARPITPLSSVRLLLTSANASPVGAIAGDLSFRSTDGEREREREREEDFPQCGKTLYAHAHPHTKPFSPQESASLSHPRKARPLSTLDNHTRSRACSPRFELDTHPQRKGLKTTSLSNHSCRSQARPPNGT